MVYSLNLSIVNLNTPVHMNIACHFWCDTKKIHQHFNNAWYGVIFFNTLNNVLRKAREQENFLKIYIKKKINHNLINMYEENPISTSVLRL